MPLGRDIESILYAELDSATKRHQRARDDLAAISKSLHGEPGDSHEEDPRVRSSERFLRNARLALLAALQRYNAFVSKGIVPERLHGSSQVEETDCETASVDAPAAAGKS